MNRWTFRSYVKDGVDVIQLWYDEQPSVVRAELLNIMMYLRDAPADDWIRPDYAELQGNLTGLGELRVITREGGLTVHYRILGFMDESALEFTMLAADRKTKRFAYGDIGALALSRKSEVEFGRVNNSQVADWIFDD